MNTLKKTVKLIFKILIICFITFFLFEIAFRNSLIDFYKTELKALNDSELNSEEIDYLIFGDSFSSAKNNYVDQLRLIHSQKIFVNASVPGIGIKQINTFAKKKIKKHNPKHIILQVYVGNDLLDVEHLTNWKKLSLFRNLYWKGSDYFLSLSYLNKLLKGLKKNRELLDVSSFEKQLFSKEKYNQREQLLIYANEHYLYNTVLLKSHFLKRYDLWKTEFTKFMEMIPGEINVSVVFIPHCSQINDYYYRNLKELGMKVKDQELYQKVNYVFYNTASSSFKEFKNLQFLNPISFFKQNDREDHRLYFANDPHLTPKGEKVLLNYINTTIIK